MPGRNGWTLLQKLRNDGFSAPVIMVSADAEDGFLPKVTEHFRTGPTFER